MAMDKENEGNRLTKLKSTGRKTADERAAVRPAGLKHGLSRLVLSTESEADFQALLDSYAAEHKPATATEQALVEQLATAAWRLRRIQNIEAGLYKLDASAAADGSDKALTILTRQQARLERSFHKALRELERMRNKRSVNATGKKASPPEQQAQPVKQVSDQHIPMMTNIPRS
jgi:hypothetical protein